MFYVITDFCLVDRLFMLLNLNGQENMTHFLIRYLMGIEFISMESLMHTYVLLSELYDFQLIVFPDIIDSQ